jgi:hypothetical protein
MLENDRGSHIGDLGRPVSRSMTSLLPNGSVAENPDPATFLIFH